MLTPLQVCKLYLLLCLGLSVNTSPIQNNLQKTESEYQQSGSSFHHESSFSSHPNYENTEIKSHFQQTLPVEQSLLSVPGVTTTFRDQNGNLVTQVKKEIVNNENGQSSRAFEFKEDKQLPNGYSKSFKKEYSSSSVTGSQPTTFVQTPLNVAGSYNSEKLTHGESSAFGQTSQNSQGSLISGNTNYVGFKPNLKFTVGQSITNVPGTTLTYKDKYGNLITQVNNEAVNDIGKNSHVFEFEETKQIPNGYAKSFKKEYSSSSVTGSQPLEVSQSSINADKYYNSEQQLHEASSTQGQILQNYQVPSLSSNTGYVGINTNSKSSVGQSLSNVPGVTSTFRDEYGNLVTQVKKEVVNSNNGQNSHAFEFEETKQLPNGYAKSFKKEYSSSSVTGSQPLEVSQNPINMQEKYYNSEQQLHGTSSTFGQSLQNYQVPSLSSNTGYVGINTNSKTSVGQNLSNVPGVTSTFRDQYGNLVTQVKKEVVNSNNGQNSHAFEFEETKQLPNGYSKSFKKEYSSSSVTGTQPLELSQSSINAGKYYNSEQLHGASSTFGQSLQNYQVPSLSSNTGYDGINTNSKTSVSQSLSNVPGVTSTFRDQYGNLVTQVKKEVVNNNNGQNSHVFEFEETKQLPNGYSKSFKKEYSSSSVINSNPTLVKDTTEKITSSPQKFTYGETEKLNGYNTFFNNQKYPLNLNGPINSKVIDNKKSTDAHSYNKVNSFGLNINNSTDCDEDENSSSSTLYQGYTQQTSHTKPLTIDQQLLNTNYHRAPKTPSGPQLEKTESFSTHTKEEVGQKSIDLHDFSKPTPIGQAPLNIDYLSKPKATSGQQLEKIESHSTQTREEIGQQSIDLHDFSKSSPIGQASVDIVYPSKPKESVGQQLEKIELFSSQKREEVGQQSIVLDDVLKPSPIGQASVNIDYPSKPKVPAGQQLEKIESYLTQTREEIGQQSIDLHDFSKSSPNGQVSVDIVYPSKPKESVGQQLEKIESFTSQKREEVGQQSIDLDDFSKPSPIGQASVNIDYPSKPKVPVGQQLEKIESYSTQTKEEVGQQSIDLDDFSKQSPIGQASVNIDYPSKSKVPVGQQLEKIESFSSQTSEKVGQQSIDLNDFSKPSPIGQASVYINTQKYPNRQNFEKTETSSTQTKSVGQQTVDLHDFSNSSPTGQESININNFYTQNNPMGQQFEKQQTSYQNKYNSVGKQLMSNIENGKSSSQYGTNQMSISQPKTGQQIQGLEFLTSNYGDTTHVLDLGTIGQKPTQDSTFGQQTVGVLEKQNKFEKNIDLHDSDYLPTNVNSYQENININHQTLHGQSKKSPVLQGQQTVDLTSDFEKHTPTYQNQNYGNDGIKKFEFSSNSGKLVSGSIDQPITSKYHNVVDKLDQLEHEILGAKSTVNMNKDNIQTSYATNHNVKSMPLQSYQKQSHFLKTTNENTQYIEPESESVFETNSELSSSSSSMKETKSVVEHDAHESQSLDNEHTFTEQPTTKSSVWTKLGDKFKGTIQNAKTKAQQIASTINEKVGF